MSHKANRRPGSNETHAPANELTPPDPQVIPKAERQRFNAEYKQRILAEVEVLAEVRVSYQRTAGVSVNYMTRG